MIYIDKLPKIIGIAFAITVLLFAGYGYYIGEKATNMCKKECKTEGAYGSYLIRSGSWKVDDACVCFFQNEIKSFRLNETEMCRLKDVCEMDLGMNLGGVRP